MIEAITHELFHGGTAVDRKVGIKYSHGYSHALDFRKKAGRMSVLPGAREIGKGNISDLIQQVVQVDNGDRYAYGNNGWIYKIDTNNDITPVTKLSDSAGGLLYRRDTDEMYATGTRTVSRYGKFSTSTPTPVIDVDKYGPSRSESQNALREGGGETFDLVSSIDEGDRIEFTPDIEPLYSFKVKLVDKGTGDWTLTMHDDANNELATVTIANADLPSQSGLVEFVFSNQVRMFVDPNARTYHMHLTSDDGTGSIQVTNEGDMTGADFEMWADRLVETNNGLHPIEQFLNLTVIGNERYLSVWEPLSEDPTNLEWLRHRLVLPPGYEINGLAANDEYLCMSAELRSSDGDRTYQHGKLFFWNGLDPTYEFYIDVPEGVPESPYTYGNTVYMIINGSLYCWPGGKQLVKVRTFEFTDSEYSDVVDQTFNYPNMLTVRRGMLLVGYPSYTTNTSLPYTIRSWGQKTKDFPMVLGDNYSISSGTKYNTGGSLYIGGIWNFGDTLYIASNDNGDYRLDIVDNSSDPASDATWESLEFDAGDPTHEKQAVALVAKFGNGIPSGYTVTPKIRYNWATSWTEGNALNDSNDYRMDLEDRFNVAEYGLNITHDGTATEPLEVTAIKFVYDDLRDELEWK